MNKEIIFAVRYLSGNVGMGCLRNALRPDEQRQQRDHGFAQAL